MTKQVMIRQMRSDEQTFVLVRAALAVRVKSCRGNQVECDELEQFRPCPAAAWQKADAL